jgi:hypothetical protein
MLQLTKIYAKVFAILVLAVATGFSLSEPILASGASQTNNTVVTLNVTAGVSISGATATTMSQALGITANDAIGTTTVTVITNDIGGYSLTVQATSSPAMKNTASSTMTIPDYQTGAPNTWNATSGQATFGYSAFGGDVVTGTWGTGAVCSAASDGNATSTTLKYKGFTTSPVTVATGASTTTPSGTATNICYAVEQKNYFIGVRAGQTSDIYQATIQATATTI